MEAMNIIASYEKVCKPQRFAFPIIRKTHIALCHRTTGMLTGTLPGVVVLLTAAALTCANVMMRGYQ